MPIRRYQSKGFNPSAGISKTINRKRASSPLSDPVGNPSNRIAPNTGVASLNTDVGTSGGLGGVGNVAGASGGFTAGGRFQVNESRAPEKLDPFNLQNFDPGTPPPPRRRFKTDPPEFRMPDQKPLPIIPEDWWNKWMNDRFGPIVTDDPSSPDFDINSLNIGQPSIFTHGGKSYLQGPPGDDTQYLGMDRQSYPIADLIKYYDFTGQVHPHFAELDAWDIILRNRDRY